VKELAMTILLDTALGFSAPSSFGLGVLDVPAPRRRPAGPSASDEVYWMAYGLGYDDEDPRCPTGLSADERDAWIRGFADGRAMGDVDRMMAAADQRARNLALESLRGETCGDGPYDMPRWSLGHPAEAVAL
jgi:hypothetical protein